MPVFPKPPVFINYRRKDAGSEAGRLNNDLEYAFGKGFVFQDIEDIESGDIWIDSLIKAGAEAKVILAVIGPEWLQLDEHKISRLMNTGDWVRRELESALKLKKIIIPVLVNRAKLPGKAQMPPSIHAIRSHQHFEMRTDRWNHDLILLKDRLSALTGVPLIEDKNVAAQVDFIIDIMHRITDIGTGINRIRAGHPVPDGFMVRNDLVPLTDVFVDLEKNRYMLDDAIYKKLYKLSQITLMLANEKDPVKRKTLTYNWKNINASLHAFIKANN